MADFELQPVGNPLNRPVIEDLPFDPNILPRFQPPQRNWLAAGLSAGVDELQGLGGSALQATGKLTGWQGLEALGKGIADRNQQEAQENGRADLEVAPWREGGAAWLPWLGYQAAKQIPQIGGMIAAGALVPEAAVPAALSRLGAAVPGMLGGGRGLAGKAAQEAGAEWAKAVTGATIAGYPIAVGSMYQQADERAGKGAGETTWGDAAQAFAMGPAYAALDALEPAFLKRMATKGATGNLLKRVATGGAAGALQEMPTEALQTAMENSFRPDMTPQQKMDNIVDAALTGGAVGGVFGGAASLRRARSVAPGDLSNEALAGLVDQAVTPSPEVAGLPALQGGREVATRVTPPAPSSNQIGGPGIAGLLGYDPITTDFTATADGRVSDNPANLSPPAPLGMGIEPQVPPNGGINFVAGADGTINQPQNFTPPVPTGAARTVFDAPQFPDAIGAEQRPALAAPPAAPKGLADIFASHSDEEVTQARAQLESDIAARKGKSTQAEMKTLRLLRAEEERRASGAEAAQPSQGGLFSEHDFDQRLKPQPVAQPKAAPSEREQQVQAVRDLAQKTAGRKTQWISKLDVTDEAGLVQQVQDRLESGASDNATFALARKYGLIDANDNPIDMAQALAQAQADLTRAKTAAITDVGAKARVTEATVKLNDLQQKAKILQDVQERRAGGAVEQQAQREPQSSAAPAPQPGLDLTFAPQVMASDAQGNVVQQPASAPAPQTFGQTRDALKPVVGKMTTDLKELDAKNLPEAVNAVEEHLTANAKPKQTYAKLAQHFGLWADGKPRSVMDAIDALTAQRDAVQQKIDALTAQQAPRSRALAAEVGEIQQKIDVLNQAREQRVQAENGRTSSPATRMQTGASEEAKALLPQRRSQLLAILRDSALPGSLRRDANIGLQKIQNQTNDALDHADNVLAAYAGHTGDLSARSTAALNPEGYAAQHAAETNGAVVYQDQDAALIRTVNRETGAIEYLGAPNPNASYKHTRTQVDIDDYHGSAFTGRVLQKLRDAKRALEAAEAAKTRDNPNGPFKDATRNVVSSTSVDPKLTELLSDWMQHLGMGKVRVFLYNPQDISEATRDQYGLHGPFRKVLANDPADDGRAGNFGVNGKDFYIAVQPGMNDRLSVETLGHELGHIIKWTAVASADTETKLALEKDYQKWLVDSGRMTKAELIRALRNVETGKKHAEGVTDATPLDMAYWRSRDEWFADNVSKYMTQNGATAGLVQKWFQRVGRLLAMAMQLIKTGITYNSDHYQPADSVRKFLDGMAASSNPLVWNSMSKMGDFDAFSKPGLSPRSLNENAQHMAQFADKVKVAADKMQNLTSKATKVILGWSSIGHIAARFAKEMPEVGKFESAHAHRQTVMTRLSQLFANTYEPLKSLPQHAQERIQKLMAYTAFGIDGRKDWTGHDFFHQEPNRQELAKAVNDAHKLWNELGKVPGAQALYQSLIAVNALQANAAHSVGLHNMVNADPELQHLGLKEDPMDRFLSENALHENPQLAAQYWADVLDGQVATISQFIKEQKGELALKTRKADIEKIKTRISPLQQQLLDINQTRAKAAQSPYFHLGRTGDYFVAFDMKRSGPDGEAAKVVDPQARAAIQKRLKDAGYGDVVISELSDKPGVFIRLRDQSEAAGLVKLLRQMQQEGHVAEKIRQGKRNDPRLEGYLQPQFLDSYVNAIKAHFKGQLGEGDEKDANTLKIMNHMISIAREQWLDMLPDTAVAKVMTHRDVVPGFNADMFQSYAQRMQIGIASLANLSAQPRISGALTDMNTNIQQAQTDPKLMPKDTSLRQDIFDEVMLREQQRPTTVGRNFLDEIRAWNHAYFLGFSPSYVFINMTQPITMLLPELGKKHGFVRASKAMAKVTPLAFRIVSAQFAEARARGIKHIGDGTITEAVLDRAKLSKSEREFLTQLINTGTVDLGSAGRELGQVAEGETDTKRAAALRMASSFGLYSETASRLIAGFAARELHGDKPGAIDYAKNTINQSMFNYSNWNISRQSGKNGFAGQYTPLALSFMQYQMQLIEKLYREGHTVLSGETKQERVEAAKFLAGHAAAMVFFAGTLGLPAATIAAGAVEKLASLFGDDDEPWDAKAAYRNFLADIFGKDAAEVIARGVPRALGFDISQRAGEADIIPFSKLLTDKRKWEDASKDWAMQTLGSPVSMASNLIVGGRELMNGNVMEALKAAAPAALRGPALAYDLSENDYTDKTGNRLPISAGAGDIMYQLLGLNPQQKAEYSEARGVQQARKGEITRRGGEIRKDLAVAIERGDTEARAAALAKAREFDRANPGFAILPRMQATLQQRAKARSMADATGNPLGVKPKDIGARGVTDFANY